MADNVHKNFCTHPELLHAIVNTALVLIDVGPRVPGRTKGGDVALGRLRDAVEPHEHNLERRTTRCQNRAFEAQLLTTCTTTIKSNIYRDTSSEWWPST